MRSMRLWQMLGKKRYVFDVLLLLRFIDGVMGH